MLESLLHKICFRSNMPPTHLHLAWHFFQSTAETQNEANLCWLLNIKEMEKNKLSVTFFSIFASHNGWQAEITQCLKKQRCCFFNLCWVKKKNDCRFLNFFWLSSALFICRCFAKLGFHLWRKHFQPRSLMKKKLRNLNLSQHFLHNEDQTKLRWTSYHATRQRVDRRGSIAL